MYTASHTTDELLHSWTRIGVGRWQIFATDIAIMRSIDKKDRRSSDPFGYSNPVRLMLSGEIRLLPDIESRSRSGGFIFFAVYWCVSCKFCVNIPRTIASVSALGLGNRYFAWVCWSVHTSESCVKPTFQHINWWTQLEFWTRAFQSMGALTVARTAVCSHHSGCIWQIQLVFVLLTLILGENFLPLHFYPLSPPFPPFRLPQK